MIALFVLLLAAEAPTVTRTPTHLDDASIESTGIEESYHAGDLTGGDHPYKGATYSGEGLASDVKQGRVELHLKKHDVFVVHHYLCNQPYLGAQMPWHCDANVFALRPATEDEGGGYVEIGRIEHTTAERVVAHPSLPILSLELPGCCDAPVKSRIVSLDGKEICAEAELAGDDAFAGVVGESITCPGKTKRKVKIPSWSSLLPAEKKVPEKKK